jgi:hypothetical protein
MKKLNKKIEKKKAELATAYAQRAVLEGILRELKNEAEVKREILIELKKLN